MIEPYYTDNLVTIYHADNRDRDLISELAGSARFDLLCTDPQYGIDRDKGFGGAEGFGGAGKPIARRVYADDWDSERPDKETLLHHIGAARLALIFGGNFFADLLPQSTHWAVWDKLNTMPTYGDCELIWTNKQATSVKKFVCEYNGLIGRETGGRFHPTQKPVRLLKMLLMHYLVNANNKPADGVAPRIIDTYLGSGTTLRAAKDLGIKAVGVERAEKYCEVSAERMRQTAFNFE